MIINNTHKFVFIHNPKCGGTSVRSVLQSFDETGGKFTCRVDHHPKLGLLDYVHIPLERLKDYFPGEFRKVEAYTSFVLVRDPLERFLSALAQHMKMYRNVSIKEMTLDQISLESVLICEYLASVDIIDNPAYIHFEKQYRFVEVEERQIVDVVLPVSLMDSLMDSLGAILGQQLKIDEPKNQSRVYRSPSRQALVDGLHPVFGSIVSRALPEKAKDVVRSMIYQSTKQIGLAERLPPDVREFVSAHYQKDIALYERSMMGVAKV